MYKIIGADQKEYGPVSADQMRQWMAEGRVNGQTMVLVEGQASWQPLSSLAEFAAATPGVAPSSVPLRAITPPPPNYLVQAIFVTLCCCLPGGIAAIVYASQVNSKHAAGDVAGAQQASANAKKWCLISVITGVVVNAIWVAIRLGTGTQGFNFNR